MIETLTGSTSLGLGIVVEGEVPGEGPQIAPTNVCVYRTLSMLRFSRSLHSPP